MTVARVNGDVVGYVVVNEWFKYERNGIELDVIAVKKEWQGKGVGSELVKEVEKFAREKGKRFIYLFVSQDNENAIGFYTKRGFHVCGFLADRYGVGKHSLIMKKDMK